MRHTLRLVGALLAAMAIEQGAEPARSFAAVVHPSNPVHDMRWRDLTALFDGVNRRWSDGTPVVLVERDAGSPPYQYLMEHLLNTTPGEYRRRLQNIEYRGDAPVPIKTLNSDAAACQFVFNVPSAIAIIEADSLALAPCSDVHVLRIDGKLPGDEGYRLK